MNITITAKGAKDESNYRTWTNINEFLNDIAFWYCGGDENRKEIGFYEGMCSSVIYGLTKNIEFTRSGLIFSITVSE